MYRNQISRKRFTVTLCLSLLYQVSFSQDKNDWPHVPGLIPESPITLTDQRVFLGVMSAAVLSYTLEELLLKRDENLNFYQIRAGVNNEHVWGLRNVYLQNFGIEKRVAHWFALALELNLQEWSDRSPFVEDNNKFGVGLGIMSYYRWYLFGRKRISPYLEYGTGLFQGFESFPSNGSKFTFNHSTQIGVEYKLSNQNRVRLGYGQFHQSNNGLNELNPGYDANGFSIHYSWLWN